MVVLGEPRREECYGGSQPLASGGQDVAEKLGEKGELQPGDVQQVPLDTVEGLPDGRVDLGGSQGRPLRLPSDSFRFLFLDGFVQLLEERFGRR